MSKKLSIAIPSYNRAPYLAECIGSILNQTFHDFDIFVFDDASEEPVEQELKKFHDKRIHCIGSDKNMGAEGNFNRILSFPFESEYLSIFHDDDTMHPKKLELQVAFMDAHRDVVFVGSDFNSVSDKNIQTFSNLNESSIQYAVYKNNYEFARAEMLWLRCAFDSVLYRAEAIGNVRMKPDRFSDFVDIALLVEISKKGPSAFIEAPLMNYRVHTGQYSEVAKKEYGQGAIEMLSLFRESLPAVLHKQDEKLFWKYSLNFLIRSYAHMSTGFLDFLRFLKSWQQHNYIRYRDFRYIDTHGIISIVSIILNNKKIIGWARWLRNRLT
jgi:glycosyltransferase involved in cell wall biosynthesis